MAEQPLGQGEGGGIDAIPVEVEVDIAPDRTPTFANFPILRAVLFLAGFDVNTALDQARRSELEARYTRIVFAHLSVGNSPDTSSTRHILSSSWIESVSALCIVAAVTVLVWQFYARPGEDGDAGPGLALHVEAPILAALCTTFALIIAVYTYLAADDSCEPILSCFSLNEVFTPANQEVCAICRESSSEDLVRLQCYSTAEEAANPQRAFHFVHSDCIALWWVEQRERWHASGQRDAAPEPRCILCNNRVLGYRPLDMASPSPSNFPVLSALAWALYFFFASTLVLFGHLSGFSYRGLPGPKDVRADWHAFVITRGILTIFLLLLSRLLFARITYAFYLVYPQLLRTYLDSSQIVSQYVLSKVRLTWSSLCSWPSFPQPLQSLVCTPEFPDAWLADSPPTSSLGKGQGWCLAIVFLVAFFIFIHRCASQAADAIYYRFPPRDIREGLRFRPRNSSVTLVNFIRRISLPLNVFNTLIFNFPSGQDMGFNSNMDYAASLVACIIWTFWVSAGVSLSVPEFLSYLRSVFISICAWVVTLYFAYLLMVVASIVLFLAFTTLREDIFPSVAILVSSHFLVKCLIYLLAQVIESLGLSQFLSHFQLSVPFLVPITTRVGGWPLPYFKMRFIEWPDMGLGAYLEPILLIIYEFPVVLKLLNLAWSNSPTRGKVL